MDVLLSPSSIKVLTSSIVCMSRIAGSSNHGGGGGSTSATSQQQPQDIYWEFDPISGLVIRTMNDAKTAYAGISYPPNFFQYCSTNRTSATTASSSKPPPPPPPPTDSQNTTTSHSTGSCRAVADRTLTCRITIKALLPIVRHRNPKSLESLRIRSYCDNGDESEDHVLSNRGRATTTDRYPSSQPLGLEFIWTLRSHAKSDHYSGHPHHHPNDIHNGNMNINSHQRLVIHRIPIVDSTTTTTVFGNVMNPMMYQEEKGDEPPSELVVSPQVLLRLLEPLQRTVEVALIVRSHTNHSGHDDFDDDDDRGVTTLGRNIPNPRNSLGSVSASSFHHSDTTYDPSQANNNNAILQATTASLLKTETACTSQEFVDFDFITTRSNNRNDANHSRDDMPDNVNDEVILVFPIKEAKAMLQFCCSAAQMSLNQPQTHQVDHQFVHVSFHWGGQPFMIQTYNNNSNNNNDNNHDADHYATTVPSSSSYHMQLVLATMDHQLLTSMRTTSTVRP